jgi:hypothetical protein
MELVFRWCRDYLFKKTVKEYKVPIKLTEAMIVEIAEAVAIILRKKEEIPKEKDEFLRYVRTILHNKKNQYYRDRIMEPIREPKRAKQMRKILEHETVIRGKQLTEDEAVLLISTNFYLDEKTSREHYIAINRKEIDASRPFMKDVPNDSQYEWIANFMKPAIRSAIPGAVEKVLEKTRENKTRNQNSKELLRALFTGLCLDKEMVFDELTSVFDRNIWETYKKEGKKYHQYEIYLMHHKEAKHPEVSASQKLKELMEELNEFLNKNHPEIFLPEH